MLGSLAAGCREHSNAITDGKGTRSDERLSDSQKFWWTNVIYSEKCGFLGSNAVHVGFDPEDEVEIFL
jgi:hypothetical protein